MAGIDRIQGTLHNWYRLWHVLIQLLAQELDDLVAWTDRASLSLVTYLRWYLVIIDPIGYGLDHIHCATAATVRQRSLRTQEMLRSLRTQKLGALRANELTGRILRKSSHELFIVLSLELHFFLTYSSPTILHATDSRILIRLLV